MKLRWTYVRRPLRGFRSDCKIPLAPKPISYIELVGEIRGGSFFSGLFGQTRRDLLGEGGRDPSRLPPSWFPRRIGPHRLRGEGRPGSSPLPPHPGGRCVFGHHATGACEATPHARLCVRPGRLSSGDSPGGPSSPQAKAWNVPHGGGRCRSVDDGTAPGAAGKRTKWKCSSGPTQR